MLSLWPDYTQYHLGWVNLQC